MGVSAAIVGSAAIGYVASENASDAATAASDRQAAIAAQQAQLARDQWDYYKDIYQPLEKSLVSEVNPRARPSAGGGMAGAAAQVMGDGSGAGGSGEGLYDTEAQWRANTTPLSHISEINPDYQGVADRASSDVASSFDKSAEIGNRNMYRLGLNPNSGNALALNRLSDIERARADAGSQNSARENERRYTDSANTSIRQFNTNVDAQNTGLAQWNATFNRNLNTENFNRRMAVAGLGKGISAQAQQGLNNAGTTQGNIAATQGNIAANQAYNTSRFVSGLPWGQWTKPNTTGTAATTGNLGPPGVDYSGGSDWSGYDAGGPSGADYFGGDFADGGEIDGPGTGTSDSIPIRASDGEYIIPADVVRRKGTEFFDKLVDKHHAPARGGLSFVRPGEQVTDVPVNNGGQPAYANGGMVRPAPKQSRVALREKTRKALSNIGL